MSVCINVSDHCIHAYLYVSAGRIKYNERSVCGAVMKSLVGVSTKMGDGRRGSPSGMQVGRLLLRETDMVQIPVATTTITQTCWRRETKGIPCFHPPLSVSVSSQPGPGLPCWHRLTQKPFLSFRRWTKERSFSQHNVTSRRSGSLC